MSKIESPPITIRKAYDSEIDWINAQYKKIDFIKSTLEREYIAIAAMQSKRCGLGRIIRIDDHNLELGGIYVFEEFRGQAISDKIVQHLLKQASQHEKVWCLPFEHLLNFYFKFDFKYATAINKHIPSEVITKYNWCNTAYSKKVCLLVR